MKITQELYKSSLDKLLSVSKLRRQGYTMSTSYCYQMLMYEAMIDNKPKVLIEKDFRLNKYNYIIK